ncbi:hypothetical protein J6590_093243 [Homalodisca vitripennis]|nr:hypothetical protein J6590_092625 [Homalodisca vitripennis]KAG8304456.1 hypothetical protein J6590_093243 [Homalodisca vitripennis]
MSYTIENDFRAPHLCSCFLTILLTPLSRIDFRIPTGTRCRDISGRRQHVRNHENFAPLSRLQCPGNVLTPKLNFFKVISVIAFKRMVHQFLNRIPHFTGDFDVRVGLCVDYGTSEEGNREYKGEEMMKHLRRLPSESYVMCLHVECIKTWTTQCVAESAPSNLFKIFGEVILTQAALHGMAIFNVPTAVWRLPKSFGLFESRIRGVRGREFNVASAFLLKSWRGDKNKLLMSCLAPFMAHFHISTLVWSTRRI